MPIETIVTEVHRILDEAPSLVNAPTCITTAYIVVIFEQNFVLTGDTRQYIADMVRCIIQDIRIAAM